MAFVITDGKQTKTGSYTPLGLAAKPLRNMGVQMVSIGVGKRNVVDARELLEIAGQDNYVYVIESFEELQNPGQAKIFRQRVCQGEHQVLHALSQNNFSMFTAPEWDVRPSQAFPLSLWQFVTFPWQKAGIYANWPRDGQKHWESLG